MDYGHLEPRFFVTPFEILTIAVIQEPDFSWLLLDFCGLRSFRASIFRDSFWDFTDCSHTRPDFSWLLFAFLLIAVNPTLISIDYFLNFANCSHSGSQFLLTAFGIFPIIVILNLIHPPLLAILLIVVILNLDFLWLLFAFLLFAVILVLVCLDYPSHFYWLQSI